MGHAQFITALDMIKGFYQVPMNPNDSEKTAFVTPLGKLEFQRMPFGLKNSPATFERLGQLARRYTDILCGIYR